MRLQYAGLVDPVAVDAAVAQTYSVDAVIECIQSCSRTPAAVFLAAERKRSSWGTCTSIASGPNRNCTASMSTLTSVVVGSGRA